MIRRSALSLASRGRLSILTFHRLLSQPDPIFPGEPTAQRFDALLSHIKTTFTVLPLSVAVSRLYDGTIPARALAITFDDGYANNLTVAVPILRKHKLPATVFVASGYLDGGCMWNDHIIEAFRSTERTEIDLTRLALGRHTLESIDGRRAAIDHVLQKVKYFPATQRECVAREVLHAAEVAAPTGLMLSRDSLRSLSIAGVEIGAHTVSHPILTKIERDRAWAEIHEGKRDLEKLLDRAVPLFAYPNGKPGQDYTSMHVQMVREAGFTAAVTTAWGAASRTSDPLQLPRFTPWTSEPWKFDLLMLRNLTQRFDHEAA
jgi:peptidoglycan/xylan/chitin deacetylase (PgdA/CDA1 family)